MIGIFELFAIGYLVYVVGEFLRELLEWKMPQPQKLSEKQTKAQALKDRAFLLSDLDGRVYIWIVDHFFPDSRLGKSNPFYVLSIT